MRRTHRLVLVLVYRGTSTLGGTSTSTTTVLPGIMNSSRPTTATPGLMRHKHSLAVRQELPPGRGPEAPRHWPRPWAHWARCEEQIIVGEDKMIDLKSRAAPNSVGQKRNALLTSHLCGLFVHIT